VLQIVQCKPALWWHRNGRTGLVRAVSSTKGHHATSKPTVLSGLRLLRLRRSCLGAPSSPGDLPAGQLPCAVVAEIGLLRAAPRITERRPHDGSLSFIDFLATVIANENGLSSHRNSLTSSLGTGK
jgi:hypothetical protein